MLEARAGDLDHLGAGPDEQVDGLGEAGQDTGLVALAAELPDDAHADAGQVALGALAGRVEQTGERLHDRGRVAGVVAADDLVQHRGVLDGAGHRTDLVQGVGQRDQPVAADRAVRRLHPDGAGHGAGLADRAAGVGAEGQRGLEGRHGGGRPAAGAAGDPVEVPRVVGGAVGGVLGGGAHRELVHVGLAQDRQARGAQPGHHGRVVRRAPALQDPRAAGGGQALRGQHVLDRDGHAVQGRGRLPGGAPVVGGGGLGERALGVDVEVGAHAAVDRGGAVERGLRQRDRGGLAGGQGGGERGGAAAGGVGAHCSSPRIRGTEKRCCSVSGAPPRACSGVRPGSTTSARKTLVRGSGCEVGGTSSPATPAMEATDSRITDSWGARWSSSASSRSIRARSARWRTSSRVIRASGMPVILGPRRRSFLRGRCVQSVESSSSYPIRRTSHDEGRHHLLLRLRRGPRDGAARRARRRAGRGRGAAAPRRRDRPPRGRRVPGRLEGPRRRGRRPADRHAGRHRLGRRGPDGLGHALRPRHQPAAVLHRHPRPPVGRRQAGRQGLLGLHRQPDPARRPGVHAPGDAHHVRPLRRDHRAPGLHRPDQVRRHRRQPVRRRQGHRGRQRLDRRRPREHRPPGHPLHLGVLEAHRLSRAPAAPRPATVPRWRVVLRPAQPNRGSAASGRVTDRGGPDAPIPQRRRVHRPGARLVALALPHRLPPGGRPRGGRGPRPDRARQDLRLVVLGARRRSRTGVRPHHPGQHRDVVVPAPVVERRVAARRPARAGRSRRRPRRPPPAGRGPGHARPAAARGRRPAVLRGPLRRRDRPPPGHRRRHRQEPDLRRSRPPAHAARRRRRPLLPGSHP
ncbi:hypothetical protein NOCARDAX2BIS_380010 [Nocardioides sp. AX2bis]|nr:hypothetical protein NOCARDAX2BIS_380010 [Nocardioides sp. AX2bis]